MIHTFYALAVIFMTHKVFSIVGNLQTKFLHSFIEFVYVLWVFLGLFTDNWVCFLTIIVINQLGLLAQWYINMLYYRMIMTFFCITEILMLLIIIFKTMY